MPNMRIRNIVFETHAPCDYDHKLNQLNLVPLDTPSKEFFHRKNNEKPHRSSFGEVIIQISRVTGSMTVILKFRATIAEYIVSYQTSYLRVGVKL